MHMTLQTADYELLSRAKEGDQAALEQAINQHKPLVISLVQRYQTSAGDREDLLSVGMMGLLKAIRQFDPSYQVQFSTYAVPLILGEIKRYFRDDGVIKVSRQFKELHMKIEKAERELEHQLQRSVTIEDLVQYLHVPREDILMAIESHFYPTSLSTPLDDDNLLLQDTIGENDVQMELDRMDLKDALEKLPPKDRLLIQLRFFEGLKQSDCAARFFVSQVQISRWEKKILAKLKELLIT